MTTTSPTTRLTLATAGAATHPPATDPPAIRTTGDDLRAVPAALRSEWIKLASIRANKAILLLTALVGALSSWAAATFVTDEVLTVAEVFVYSTVLTAGFAAIAGILLFTSEAQHGTLAAALTARPRRTVLVVSKTITATALGLALGAAGMAAGIGGAVIGGLDMGDLPAMAATAMWALLFTSLAAVLGTGVGMIARHSAGAISGLLMWWLVAENLLYVFMPAQISRFLPFYAGDALLGFESDFATAENIAVALTRPQNALVFAGYTVAALVVGAVLLHRRD